MRKLITILLFTPLLSFGQSETHDFTTYDTSITIGVDKWIVRISRPKTDTASRPAFFMMEGQGEQGSNAAITYRYGPHYWLNNGWDGSVVLGNGVHYPILFTSGYVNNVYPSAPAYYNLLKFLIKTYHVKANGVHLTGLSQGAFTAGALIMYEQTAGAETGMSLVTSLAAFEGTPDPLPAPYNSWSRGFTAYQVWAKKYNGRYFYLEGSSDNFRDGWQYANAMNASVPGSAYFSYEGIGGGGHCCWNAMYDPKATNWTCVGMLGPNNAPSQTGTNTMGNYKPPENVFQWMYRNGDTSLVGSSPIVVIPNKLPVPIIGPINPITAPTDWVVLDGSASYDPDGTIDSVAWSQVSGPAKATIISTTCDLKGAAVGLVPGTYIFKLQVWDNKGASTVQLVSVIVNSTPVTVIASIPLSYTIFGVTTTKTIIVKSDGSYIIQ